MKRLLSVCIFSLILSVCVSAKTPAAQNIEDLQKLVEQVEAQCDAMTDEDWQVAQSKYDTISSEMAKCEYSDEELREIGRQKGRYAKVKSKHVVGKATGVISNIFQQGMGVVEGFFDGVTERVPEVLDSISGKKE